MANAELTHYGFDQYDKAKLYNNHYSCYDKRLSPACGNGNYHAITTRVKQKVDCPECLKRIK